MSKSTSTIESATAATKEAQPVVPMRVLKIGTTKTVSGKSDLRYHITCDANLDIYIRVVENTASGYFSDEHVSLKAIQDVFLKAGDKPISSFAIFSLLNGRSQNTPAFICSCLNAEGLIQHSEQKPRCYVAADGTKFMRELKQAIDQGVDLKVDEKSKPSKVTATSPKTATSKPVTDVAIKAVTAKANPKDKDAPLTDWARDGGTSNVPVAPVVSKAKPIAKK